MAAPKFWEVLFAGLSLLFANATAMEDDKENLLDELLRQAVGESGAISTKKQTDPGEEKNYDAMFALSLEDNDKSKDDNKERNQQHIHWSYLPSFRLSGLMAEKQPKSIKDLKNRNARKVPLRLRSEDNNKTSGEKRRQEDTNNAFIQKYNLMKGEYPYRHEANSLDSGDEHVLINFPEPARQLLAQVAEITSTISTLKTLIERLEKENAVKKVIREVFIAESAIVAGATGTFGNLWNQLFKKETVLNKETLYGKIANAVLQYEIAKYNKRAKQQVVEKPRHGVKYKKGKSKVSVTQEMNPQYAVGLLIKEELNIECSADHLIFQYNQSELLYCIDELNQQLKKLNSKYQGFTIKEKQQSLLEKYKAVIRENRELDEFLEYHKMDHYFFQEASKTSNNEQEREGEKEKSQEGEGKAEDWIIEVFAANARAREEKEKEKREGKEDEEKETLEGQGLTSSEESLINEEKIDAKENNNNDS